jgi:hypothetical protein
MRHRPFVIACAGAALAAAGLLLGPAAAAQEGRGIITLEATHPAGTSVHFIVRVTSASDGRPAAGAVVTATAVDGDGTQLPPVTLAPADGDGRYANAIDFGSPGTWTVRFASVNPTGTAEVTQTVEADDAGGDDSADSADEGGFAPADDNTGASGAASGSDDGGGMPVWIIVAAAVVAFGGAFMGLRTVRRYRREASAEEARLTDLEAAGSARKRSDTAGGASPPPPRPEA